MMRTVYRRIAVAALALSAGGCSSIFPDRWDDHRDELERNRNRWRNADVASYRYTLDTQCFCPYRGPVEITVVNGQVTSAVTLETGPVPEDEWAGLRTVPRLFDFVEETIDREPDVFQVTYDAEYGHPALIQIDRSRRFADDELRVTVEGLTKQ